MAKHQSKKENSNQKGKTQKTKANQQTPPHPQALIQNALSGGQPLNPSEILILQRAIGNQRTMRLLGMRHPTNSTSPEPQSNNNIVQRTQLTHTNQVKTRGKVYYLCQNKLVKALKVVTATSPKKKGTVSVQVVYPGSDSSKINVGLALLDDGVGSQKYGELSAKYQGKLNEAKEAHDEEKRLRAEQAQKPNVIWAKAAFAEINGIADRIYAHVKNSQSKERGVNELTKDELTCVRAFQTLVDSKDPYIAVKELDDGNFAVRSNRMGTRIYSMGGSTATQVNVKIEKVGGLHGHAQHCEAALNYQFDTNQTNHKAAKATKVEGGHSVGGSHSQNCLLCSLDAIRRGYKFDPHGNPPNHWNYQVLDHASHLFSGNLKGEIIAAINRIQGLNNHPGNTNQLGLGSSDQQIVDKIKDLYNLAEGQK